jgi:hypothetical protein
MAMKPSKEEPVRLAASFPVAAALLVLGCGNGQEEPQPAAAPAEYQQPEPASSVTAEMVALDGSGIAGSVYIETAGEQPVITVSLRNAVEGVHQGHIHGGTCADRTRAIVPLQPVVVDADGSGSATSTVELPAETLLDGNHIVVYHEAGGAPGASVVCGEIPARGM